ncbi:MAG: two-component regulator propeller domain-containing protein [Bacteroidia bacterium]
MKMYLQICSLCLLTIFCVSCKGQEQTDPPKATASPVKQSAPVDDPYFVESDSVNSLYGPTSITRNMIEDRQGNIWIATWEGIIRYDGNSFTNFTIKEDLSRFHVFAVFEDSQGNLWFGTIGAGAYRYDGKTFTHFTTKEGLVNDRVACFYEDNVGNIWIGTQGGVSRFDGNSFRNYTSNEGMTDNDVNSITQDNSGRFWIGTRGEACFFDGKNFTKITNDLGSPFTNVRSIIKDSKDNIWLSGNDGLWHYDGSTYVNYTKDFVGYIYQDSKGSIWTSSVTPNATGWSISRYDATLLVFNQTIATPVKTGGKMYFGILEDSDGGIWFGTLNGVCRYDGSNFNYFRDPNKK